MKRIENKKTWNIKEKMVELFRTIGSAGVKEKRKYNLFRGENPIQNKAYKHTNSPRTLAFVR